MPDKQEPERDQQSLAEDLFAQFLTAREQGQSPDFEALLRQLARTVRSTPGRWAP
jgi:hypothetical protein